MYSMGNIVIMKLLESFRVFNGYTTRVQITKFPKIVHM